MAISHFYCQSSYWQMKWQIYWQIYPPVVASSGQEWQFHISTIGAHIGRWSGRSTGRSTPQVVASSGQEWWFHISTVRAHIGRSTGRSTPWYWHLVVKNGNFTFLLLELILVDQVADLLADLPPPDRPRWGVLRARPFTREGNYVVFILSVGDIS